MSVYFAKESKNGWIKIGTSKNPKQRVVSIFSQYGSDIGKTNLLKVIDGSFDEEKFYQGLLKYDRADPCFSHEWFLPTDDVMFFVNLPTDQLNDLSEQVRELRFKYGKRIYFEFNGDKVVMKAKNGSQRTKRHT